MGIRPFLMSWFTWRARSPIASRRSASRRRAARARSRVVMAPSRRLSAPISSPRSLSNATSSRSMSTSAVFAASAVSGRLIRVDSHEARSRAISAVTSTATRNDSATPRRRATSEASECETTIRAGRSRAEPPAGGAAAQGRTDRTRYGNGRSSRSGPSRPGFAAARARRAAWPRRRSRAGSCARPPAARRRGTGCLGRWRPAGRRAGARSLRSAGPGPRGSPIRARPPVAGIPPSGGSPSPRESATRTRSGGRAPPRRIRGGDGRERSWRGEAERAVPVERHPREPASDDGMRADVEQWLDGGGRAPRRQLERRTAHVVHAPPQLEHVRGVGARPERGFEGARRDARRDGTPSQGAQTHDAGREIGGAPIALVVDDAASPSGGRECVAPRLNAAWLQLGEPEAAGARPFRRASVAVYRLAEALQAEVTDHRLVLPRGEEDVRPTPFQGDVDVPGQGPRVVERGGVVRDEHVGSAVERIAGGARRPGSDLHHGLSRARHRRGP